MNLTHSSAWLTLTEHAQELQSQHLNDLLTPNTKRFEQLSFRMDDFLLDLSKQRVTTETITHLIQLAEQQDLQKWIQKLFDGDKINSTENRPALHPALRLPANKNLHIDGENVSRGIHKSLEEMASVVKKIHHKQWRSFDGSAILDIVNIGVGGSDLGPLMACTALQQWAPQEAKQLNMHFVSSMDGSQLERLLDKLNPATTLFIISSKSFATIDTLANANTALEWLLKASNLPVELITKHHFIAVTSQCDKALEWGIPKKNQLKFWDWTGGRYSMWSVIGLPIALKIGMEHFNSMLSGAHKMDRHFQQTPMSKNLPILLGLIGVWNINFLNIHSHAILPYDGRLAHFPAYLGQLEMESNGKNVTRDGNKIGYHSCPVIWGEIGPNAQHAFYQLLHQGTEQVMCDFIVPATRYEDHQCELKAQHNLALSNCLAQSRLLALGDNILDCTKSTPNHKRYSGNQPSTTIMFQKLTPSAFGSLIALYEHKVFVQSVIWDINPFDQWGVELGKQVATSLMPQLTGPTSSTSDTSTKGLLDYIKSEKQKRLNDEANS